MPRGSISDRAKICRERGLIAEYKRKDGPDKRRGTGALRDARAPDGRDRSTR